MPRLRDLPEEQLGAALDWLESLPNHPEVGNDIKRALKKANPNVNFPELDLEDRVSQATAKQAEEIASLRAEIKDRENKAYWDGKKKKVVEDGYVKSEELEDFHKWIVDEHIGNYDRAAKMWHDEKHAAAEPTNYQDMTGIQLPSNEGLFQNPIRWARDEAMKSINEIRRGKQY